MPDYSIKTFHEAGNTYPYSQKSEKPRGDQKDSTKNLGTPPFPPPAHQSEQHVTGGSVGTKDVISHQKDDERGKERHRGLPRANWKELVLPTPPYPSFTSQNHTPHGNPVRPIPTSPANTPCPNPNTINLKV
ncbi:hypothetical protein M8J75_011140 [Diaphorina citri]|nr:hypothetical protein M8J75_011140 [Diaphorina citri]